MGGNKTPIIDTRLLRHPDSPDWLRRLHARAAKGEDISEVIVPPFMRRITVSEAAALQGFPKDFKFLGSRCDKYRQIGNSVPPPLAEAVAREVVKAMLKSDR
jgi:DNA (cytosine-5)-methyltransferase 1